MEKALVILSLCLFSSQSPPAYALHINNVTCSGSTLHGFRVEGCSEEPCTVKKGERIPFEIDLSFATPRELADDVYFNVFIPKYAKPPAVHGSSLITATCDQGGLGFECPLSSNTMHTLRSHLYIDPETRCTGRCQLMGPNGTGLRDSKWRWTIANRRLKTMRKAEKAGGKQKAYSSCNFKLTLNIVE